MTIMKVLSQKLASSLRFFTHFRLWGMTDEEYSRASKELWNSMREMSGIFARQGFPELAAGMTGALRQHLPSDIYSAVAICAQKALKEPGLDAETHAKLRKILKMMKTM